MNCQRYSKKTVPFYSPVSIVRGSWFLYILASVSYHLLFSTILICVKWYLIVVSLCISLMANDIEHLFVCFFVIHTYLLMKRLFMSFLTIEFWDIFIYSKYKLFVKYLVCKYFLPISNPFSHSLRKVFHRAKDFNFNKVHFFLLKTMFLDSCLKLLT